MDPTLFELAPQEFEGVIAELGLPQSEADQLRRQYRRQNSMFAGLYGLLDSVAGRDAEQGRVRADVLPMTRPEGMTGIEALLSGNAELAIPGYLRDSLLGSVEAAAMGIDAPAAAYQGMIPAEDMAGEALGTAGMAMTGGGAVARPAGSVGMGGRVVNFGEARQERARQSLIERLTRAISDVTSGEHQRRMDAIGLEAHQRGILPLPLGARVSPPQGWDMPGDWSIDGYWVDTINPQRSGYRLINSEGQVYNAPVFDPQIGYSTQNPYLFGGGFRAYAGPSQNRIEYDNLPERREVIATDRTPEESAAIDAEYRALFGDELSANRSTAGGAVGLLASESRAQRIARMLREGRGDEITDDMLAALDANDNMELAQLYAAGETGVDMPMDFDSRMARAREMGRISDQYHATNADFPAFIASQTGLTGRGIYTGDSAPDVFDYARARQDGIDGLNIIPLVTPDSSNYARRIDWQNVLDADPDLPYNATWQQEIEGFQRAAENMSGQGFLGVHSQPGERVTFEPRNVRSRFARFDPRLGHLENLNAANASTELGLLALAASAPSEEDQLDQLRAYLGLLNQ
jgi:hypothetical protein